MVNLEVRTLHGRLTQKGQMFSVLILRFYFYLLGHKINAKETRTKEFAYVSRSMETMALASH